MRPKKVYLHELLYTKKPYLHELLYTKSLKSVLLDKHTNG